MNRRKWLKGTFWGAAVLATGASALTGWPPPIKLPPPPGKAPTKPTPKDKPKIEPVLFVGGPLHGQILDLLPSCRRYNVPIMEGGGEYGVTRTSRIVQYTRRGSFAHAELGHPERCQAAMDIAVKRDWREYNRWFYHWASACSSTEVPV